MRVREGDNVGTSGFETIDVGPSPPAPTWFAVVERLLVSAETTLNIDDAIITVQRSSTSAESRIAQMDGTGKCRRSAAQLEAHRIIGKADGRRTRQDDEPGLGETRGHDLNTEPSTLGILIIVVGHGLPDRAVAKRFLTPFLFTFLFRSEPSSRRPCGSLNGSGGNQQFDNPFVA